jgi:hypothetical protein
MKYIRYEKIIYQTNNKEEWTARITETIDEAAEILQVIFDYVTDWAEAKIFRKHK